MIYKTLDNNTGELRFYGDISEWWISGTDFTRTIEEMDAKFKTIHIRVHCYGGEVFEGNVMYNAIQRCKARVIIYIDGVAASMMSIVMLAADEIIAASNAFIMIHNPSGYTRGNARAHTTTAKLLTSMEKNFAKVYAERSGKTEKEVSAWFDGQDHWFSAEEALDMKLITGIADPVVVNVLALDKPLEDGQVEIIFGQFAALLENPLKTQQSENNNMKKELIAKFNLQGVTENSTDAEILAAVEAVKNQAGTDAKATVKAAIEAVISGVEKASGKTYDQNMRAQLVTVGETNGLEVLQTMLGLNAPAGTSEATNTPAAPAAAAIPQVVNLLNSPASTASAADNRASWDWDTWQEKDPDGIEDLEKTNLEAFKKLYNAKFKTSI